MERIRYRLGILSQSYTTAVARETMMCQELSDILSLNNLAGKRDL